MIIYLYLTIIIVCSIITGIITTIIEKKGFKSERRNQNVVQQVIVVNKEMKPNNGYTVAIPIIKPDNEYTQFINQTEIANVQTSYTEDDDEPILLID